MKQISYPKIPQFRNVVSTINRMSSFKGMDINDQPIYDDTMTKPIIKFKGTVKAHGTNAGICYNEEDGIYTQSRNNPFDIELNPDSHMGFTFFVKKNKEIFIKFFETLYKENDLDPKIYTLSIYGEWAGKGIQKGVALSELEKAFYIFGVKVSKLSDPLFNSFWIDYTNLRDTENRIFNIDDFGTYEVEVDFNMPLLASNKFAEITEQVEKECPIGKYFGVSGIGEGVVWTGEYKGTLHRMKIKGEKHSVSKVKTLAPVDTEKLNSIKDFIDYAVTENRFLQGVQQVFGEDKPDIKQMGNLIRWCINDIISEEIDTLAKNNLEPKDVNKYISNAIRGMFQALLNKEAGLK